MARYLIAIHRPNSYDASISEDKQMSRDIDALNDEMVAAGVRVFVGGLQPVEKATSLIPDTGGEIRQVMGAYLQAQDYVDGFWVLEAASLDEAISWGRKAAIACRGAVEVRPLY